MLCISCFFVICSLHYCSDKTKTLSPVYLQHIPTIFQNYCSSTWSEEIQHIEPKHSREIQLKDAIHQAHSHLMLYLYFFQAPSHLFTKSLWSWSAQKTSRSQFTKLPFWSALLLDTLGPLCPGADLVRSNPGVCSLYFLFYPYPFREKLHVRERGYNPIVHSCMWNLSVLWGSCVHCVSVCLCVLSHTALIWPVLCNVHTFMHRMHLLQWNIYCVYMRQWDSTLGLRDKHYINLCGDKCILHVLMKLNLLSKHRRASE